jgi:hypothetical protein
MKKIPTTLKLRRSSAITLLLTICSATALLNAYENSFFNNTDEPIGIAIQYTGNDTNEPLYKQLVKPKSNVIFTPGKAEIPEIKWGFCLDKIYYIQNPTTEQKAHNFEKTIWKQIPITWVKTKSTTKQQTKKLHGKEAIKKPVPAAAKSLCRDRHFDIIKDEHSKVVITSSLVE